MYKINFSKPINVHFMGIGGISMSGLAEILLKAGFKVTGSDMKASEITDQLSDMGALINIGQCASNITDNIDLVVYTAAIHPDNEEFKAAAAKNIPMLTRAQLLGQTPAAFVLADASENLSDSDAQKVEKKLLGNGKHVLLISDSEATVPVLTALNNAGIIALVSGKADLAGYDKYKKLESADSDLTGSALIESIADQIDKATNL